MVSDVGPGFLLLLGVSSSLDRQGKGSGKCVSVRNSLLEKVSKGDIIGGAGQGKGLRKGRVVGQRPVPSEAAVLNDCQSELSQDMRLGRED